MTKLRHSLSASGKYAPCARAKFIVDENDDDFQLPAQTYPSIDDKYHLRSEYEILWNFRGKEKWN